MQGLSNRDFVLLSMCCSDPYLVPHRGRRTGSPCMTCVKMGGGPMRIPCKTLSKDLYDTASDTPSGVIELE